jgi:fused signal recognition particle receptor
MAFFKKLKDRLFKSSSKIEDGLDAIVEDGGTEDVMDAQAEAQAAEDDAARQRQQDLEDQAARERAAIKAEQAAEAKREEDARVAAAQAAADKAREDAERAAAQAKAQAAQREAQDQAAALAQQAAQHAEDQARAEAARLEEVAKAAERARLAEEEKRAEDQRIAQEKAEAARREDQARADEAARAQADREAAEAAAKPGLLGRLLGRGEKKSVVRRELDDDMLEQLEELLITADMGVDTALRVTANMAEGRFGKRLSTHAIKELLAAEVTRIMEPVARPMPLYPTKPQVVLVVGVNGSGKTTTIGKLASQFQAAGKKVVIAAGDTFRAAAVEQLQVWGDRAGVPVLTAPEGSDPASLAFEAMEKAAADGADLLMIDTAGRLQNRSDLMEELSKIVRVIRKKDPDAPHNTLLVLDATTGQNALSQVKTFQELADVSGLVMTKLDGTAKGGVLVALADKFGLPIHAIGVGEQIDDLAPFDPEDFAAALTGLDR